MVRYFIQNSLLACMLVLFAGQATIAQDLPPAVEDYSYSNWRRAMAKWQVNNLHDGVLLVRLKSNQRAIDTLRAVGNHKYANRIENEHKADNAELIAAFKSEFDFCDVYFFKSEYSQLVREHKLDSIPFVASILVNPESGPLSPSTPFLVAELALLEPDTVARADYYHPQVKESNNAVGYNVNSNLGIPGLIFKSDQIIQLNEPFPYYVRTYKSIDFFVNRPLEKVVKIANERLHYFYGTKIIQEVPEKNPQKIKRQNDFAESGLPKATLAFYGGYSRRLANDIRPDTLGSAYTDQLKNGLGFGTDMDFFFSKNFGWGLRYLFNHYNAEDKDLNLTNDITIHTVGPRFTTRYIGGNSSDVVYFSAGIMYAWYKDRKNLDHVKSEITAETMGFSFDVAYDYDLSKRVAMTVQLGVVTGTYEKYNFENADGEDEDLRYPDNDGDKLFRLELKAGIRLK